MTVPAYGTITLHKANHAVNETQAPADDEFEITCTAHPADDHDETLF